ncbi:MAG: hypothetical protein EOP81_02275 [Variovorax sp.]|nr:MAG: hypothetical protein EOP81_02275 [Variovorax sp.]
MKSLIAIAILLAAALAHAERIPTPAEADRLLARAERELAAANNEANRRRPDLKDLLKEDTAEWRARVEKGCASDETGSLAGSAAALDYANTTACKADATTDRANLMRKTIGVKG